MRMMNLRKLRWARDLFLVCFLIFAVFISSVSAQERISKPGQYKGYSQPIYDEWVRSSQYITVRDGTKLAVDIFRPARDGKPVSEPLPVVWAHDRYQRATFAGKLITELDQSPWLQQLLKHGYIVGVVDVRGGGASYGTREGPFSQEESRDAYDVTEWFAAQPWCDGNIGMFGRSYLGITQYFAASTSPPHLKAIFPEMAMFDLYSFTYPGGVFHHDFITLWGNLTKQLDTLIPVAPVNGDSDGSMLKQAITEHAGNRDVLAMSKALPFRNSHDEAINSRFNMVRSPSSYIDQIRESGVAIYHWAGWYDMYSRDALLWFHNLDNPQKLTVGPWHHSGGSGIMVTEHLRWYDYWLKGIENGIMEEAPIFYHVMGAPEGSEWRTASQWSLPNEKSTSFYFVGGPTGTVDSANDGSLSISPPIGENGKDVYTVDYSTTSGTATRWTNGYGGAFDYPDMTANDSKAVTYTSSALDSDTEVTGHPIVHLWISSTAEDGDFFVYLEEVDKEGVSHYITEGTLRASHCAVSEPPFGYLGLPYHRSFEEDLVALPQEPVELVLDLLPTSNLFDEGHRIRVTVTCSDRDTALTPELEPPPTVMIYRDADYPSRIILPVILEDAAIETPGKN